MPGSSFWLLPPKDHPLDPILSTLIQKTATRFGSPHLFLPHITLTSDISASSYAENPQAWLDNMDFPTNVQVRFNHLASEDVFVRKLYVKIRKDESICTLAAKARRVVGGFEDEDKAQKWVQERYKPHLSLL
jgi:2',3'-cyclic-nucleotide 3'-phosphodiesterase